MFLKFSQSFAKNFDPLPHNLSLNNPEVEYFENIVGKKEKMLVNVFLSIKDITDHLNYSQLS